MSFSNKDGLYIFSERGVTCPLAVNSFVGESNKHIAFKHDNSEARNVL